MRTGKFSGATQFMGRGRHLVHLMYRRNLLVLKDDDCKKVITVSGNNTEEGKVTKSSYSHFFFPTSSANYAHECTPQ